MKEVELIKSVVGKNRDIITNGALGLYVNGKIRHNSDIVYSITDDLCNDIYLINKKTNIRKDIKKDDIIIYKGRYMICVMERLGMVKYRDNNNKKIQYGNIYKTIMGMK